MDRNGDERVRTRAYELWEREGRPEGKEHEHWDRAERELHAGEPGGGEAAGSGGDSPSAAPGGIASGLQPGGSAPSASPGAGAGSIGTGGASTGDEPSGAVKREPGKK